MKNGTGLDFIKNLTIHQGIILRLCFDVPIFSPILKFVRFQKILIFNFM